MSLMINKLISKSKNLIQTGVFPSISQFIRNKTMLNTEKEVSVKAPWGNIAVLTWGDEKKPPVLLVPGKMDTASDFRPLLRLLPPNFYYVGMDLPGNGRSDHQPKGLKVSVLDMVPSIDRVVTHFQFKNFVYIGHSLGVIIGKYYNIAYPGMVTKMVEIDPLPAHMTFELEDLKNWYHYYYADYYKDDKYRKFNGSVETAPKYTYEKAMETMLTQRKLTREAAEHLLERSLDPAGDGLYRYSYDQRMKQVPFPPFPAAYLEKIYTSISTPTYCFLSDQMLALGHYDKVPFVLNPKAWPHGNYSYKIVDGSHDVHMNNPQSMAKEISEFLLDVKAKL